MQENRRGKKENQKATQNQTEISDGIDMGLCILAVCTLALFFFKFDFAFYLFFKNLAYFTSTNVNISNKQRNKKENRSEARKIQ